MLFLKYISDMWADHYAAYQREYGGFASDAGKKASEFYTPKQVSRLLAQLAAPRPGDRICDPSCGSGGLLIEAAALVEQQGSRDFALFGQEVNGGTWALARMNMFLHGKDAARIDYDPNTEASQRFFASVQNKMHWAAHGHTAAEIVYQRADAERPNMGLTSWIGAPSGQPPRKADAGIAKNYLDEDELQTLNRIVTAYLEFAELQAMRRRPMYMTDWIAKLDEFLRISDREVLDHAGRVSHEQAKGKAEAEFPMYVVFGLDETKVNSDYFLHWLDSHEARERIKNSAQGSVRETVSFTEFAALTIPLPDPSKQTAIAHYLNALREEIALLGQSVEALKTQKRGLMQKLLPGQWRLPPEHGESA
jgi:hypothetical protein